MEDTNDIVTFMKQLQMNMTKISEDIKLSNEKIGKDIKESREEMQGEMQHLNQKIDLVNDKTEKLIGDVENVKVVSDNRFKRMEERMMEMEKEQTNIDRQKRKREDIVNREKEAEAKATKENMDSQPAGRNGDKMSYADRTKNDKVEELPFKSQWARQMSQTSLAKQLEQVTRDAKRMEDEAAQPLRSKP